MPLSNQKGTLGRRHDHERSSEPVVLRSTLSEHASKWQSYARASKYGHAADETSRIVDEEWLRTEYPDLEKPWNANGENAKPQDKGFWLFDSQKRRSKGERLHVSFSLSTLTSPQANAISQFILMSNAFVPLLIRTTVLLFVAAALALGAWIYHESNLLNNSPVQRAGTLVASGSESDFVCQQQTSTYMAFIVDSCAVIYLAYITWDEYTSEPLGRRRGRDKMRLLYLDLLFIVFSSANLSLAFNTVTDQQWSCYGAEQGSSNNNNAAAAATTCVQSNSLCKRQKALCGVLTCALVAWLMTFAISVMRYMIFHNVVVYSVSLTESRIVEKISR